MTQITNPKLNMAIRTVQSYQRRPSDYQIRKFFTGCCTKSAREIRFAEHCYRELFPLATFSGLPSTAQIAPLPISQDPSQLLERLTTVAREHGFSVKDLKTVVDSFNYGNRDLNTLLGLELWAEEEDERRPHLGEFLQRTLRDLKWAYGEHEESLDLSERGLVTLPKELGQFKALKTLNVSGNRLESVPSELSTCESLEELNLRGNDLVSPPDNLAEYPNLKALNLSMNRLAVYYESACHCRNLSLLDLRDNFIKTLPEAIAQIDTVRLENNMLTLSQLKPAHWKLFLRMDKKALKHRVSQWECPGFRLPRQCLRNTLARSCKESTTSNFQKAKVIVNGIRSLGAFNPILLDLTEWDFDCLQIESVSMAIAQCVESASGSLTLDNLGDIELTDLVMRQRSIKKVEITGSTRVTLTGTRQKELSYWITERSQEEIAKWAELTDRKTAHEELKILKAKGMNCTKIRESLSENKQWAGLPTTLKRVLNLHIWGDIESEDIRIRRSNIDVAIDRIIDAEYSNSLDLANLGLSSIPNEVGRLTEIEFLDLDRNLLEEVPVCLVKLPKLFACDLSSNSISRLSDFFSPTLKVLNVSRNQVTTISPQFWERMQRNMIRVNLSYNQLSQLPRSLKALGDIRVSKNRFNEDDTAALKAAGWEIDGPYRPYHPEKALEDITWTDIMQTLNNLFEKEYSKVMRLQVSLDDQSEICYLFRMLPSLSVFDSHMTARFKELIADCHTFLEGCSTNPEYKAAAEKKIRELFSTELDTLWELESKLKQKLMGTEEGAKILREIDIIKKITDLVDFTMAVGDESTQDLMDRIQVITELKADPRNSDEEILTIIKAMECSKKEVELVALTATMSSPEIDDLRERIASLKKPKPLTGIEEEHILSILRGIDAPVPTEGEITV